jgi:hypothetical protein
MVLACAGIIKVVKADASKKMAAAGNGNEYFVLITSKILQKGEFGSYRLRWRKAPRN